MMRVNLIPAPRMLARQRQRHVRRCVVACSAWAFVVAGVCAVGNGLLPRGSADESTLAERLERAALEAESNGQAMTTAKAELAAAQATLRATRAIANQPDWSVLMALLGKATGDDVMLRSFELQPPDPQAAAPRAVQTGKPAVAAHAPSRRQPSGFVLSASGLAQSQLAVTQFVLRLERVGLFSRVTLLDTSREPFRDGEATSFRVECVIGGATPAATTVEPGRSGKR